MRRMSVVALVLTLGLPLGASAQAGEALLRQVGAASAVPNPSFVADPSLDYRVVWDVSEGPAKPSERTPGLARPANFFTIAEANGVDRKRVHLALILYGGATPAVMTNEAYRAAHGVDNPNVALLQALTDAGVQVIVCGQALLGRKVGREQVLPFVKVATSATFARATLHAQGYATFLP